MRIGIHQQPKYKRHKGGYRIVGYYFEWYVYGPGQDQSNASAKGTSKTKEAAQRAAALAKRKIEFATKGVNVNRKRKAKRAPMVVHGRVV